MGRGRYQIVVWIAVLSLISPIVSGQAHYWSFDQSKSIFSIRDERGAKTLANVIGDGASFTTVYTSTSNNYLTLSKKSSLNLGEFSDCSGNLNKCRKGITISLIVRFHPDYSSEEIIKSTSNQITPWSLSRKENILTFTLRHAIIEHRVEMKLKTGVWNQYTFVFTKKSLKAYINGRQAGTSFVKQLASKVTKVKSSTILLGSAGSDIHADYDDIGIWHWALSRNTIEHIYEKILERIVLSKKCSDVTSSRVCLEWNQRDDLYDLVGSIHIAYSDQNIEELILNRTAVSKKQNTHCVKHLDAEMTYEFRVVTILTDGQTQKSNSIRCSTKDGIPAPPRVNDISVQNGTTIVLKWERPRPTLGTIVEYEIKLSAQNKETRQYKHVRTFPFSGNLEGTTVALKGLQELTKYRIVLTSLGKVGTGRSTVVYASTFQQFDKLSEVSEVYVTETNDREINIQWKPMVQVMKIPNLKYKVRYRKYQGDYQTTTVSGPNVTLKGLDEKTAYFINLQPVLNDKKGPWKKQDFLVKTKDRNECSVPFENLCDALAECVNTPNGYTCICSVGYYGDGRVCRKIPSYVTKAHFCQENLARGITWPELYSGDEIVTKCPSGADGFATRRCNKATIHSHAIFARADLSQCVSREIGDLEVMFMDRVGQEMEAILKLENATRTIDMYGGDIPRTLEYTDVVVKRIFPIKNPVKTLKIIQGITAISSNLLDKMADEAWHDIPKNNRKSFAERLINSLESLATKYQNATNDEFNSVQDNLAIKATTLDNAEYFDKQEGNKSSNLYSIELPIGEIKSKGMSSNVVFSSFENVGSYLQNPSNGLSVSKSIISASLVNEGSIKFEDDPVVITVPHPENSIVTSPSCVYWDTIESTWSSDGCHVNKSDANATTCHCYHLTNFAVLMSVTPKGTEVLMETVHAFNLRIITIICLSISIVVLTIALFTFICFRFLRSARTSYHRNLALSLLCASIIFLGGINQTGNVVTCRVVAALLEYFYLVSFVWMAIEGVLLYYMLRKVFKDQKLFKRKLFQASCWLGPAVYVGIFAIVYPENYGTPAYCWLSYEGGFIWSFAAPVLIVIMFNTVVVCLAFRIMSERSKDNETDFKHQVWYWTKGCFVLMFILGITWVFGLLHVANNSIAMAYIFSILNALQGLFIFIFHCLIDPKIRQEYVRILKCQSRSAYNEVNGYSTSMRFRKLSTSLTNSTTLERKPKILTSSVPSSPAKAEEILPASEQSPNDSYESNEDKRPLLQQQEPSPVMVLPPPKPPRTPSPCLPPASISSSSSSSKLPSQPLVTNGRAYSNASTSGYEDEDSIEVVTDTDQSFSLRSSDESQDTIKELTSFVLERPKCDVIVNPFGEELLESSPPLTSEKKPLPRDSVMCEEVFQNESFSEPWRLSIFDRIDAENEQEEKKELEELSKHQFEKPQPIVHQYESEEEMSAPSPKRKQVKEEQMDLAISNPNVESENTYFLSDDLPPKKPPRKLPQQLSQTPIKVKVQLEKDNNQSSEKVKSQPPKVAKKPFLDKVKHGPTEDEVNRISIPSKIIHEISDVMEEIPVAAQPPSPRERRRLRNRRRMENNNSKSSLEHSDENDFSPIQSPSPSSAASSSSNISSTTFDHESLFKGVDDEIEQDYQRLERKRERRKKRPTTPTYRAEMEIIQFKPGTSLISPQRDVVVNPEGDENLAFEY